MAVVAAGWLTYPADAERGVQAGPQALPTGPPARSADEVDVPVGSDLQSLVEAHPAGTTFRIAAGTHRFQEVTPKDGDVFLGEPGSVLDGARLLQEFLVEHGTWYAPGQRQEGQAAGECTTAAPLCALPDVVFLDGRVAERVGGRAELRPGTYYFDYGDDRIWFGDDPRGRRVEAAVTPRAFSGAASDVRIHGLVVQHYATPAQRGAVDASDGRGWHVEGVTARLNHGGGLRAGSGTRILRCSALQNGQIGVTGTGAGIVIDATVIADNGTAGFAPGWEAGGTKFALTQDLVVKNSRIRGNQGHGLWTDVDNVRTTYEGNDVADNTGEGIFHEISGSAVIRNNVVRRNGSGFSEWVFGAGIHVASSSSVDVVDNLVEDNANGIVGTQQRRGEGRNGERQLRDLHVHGNTVRSSGLVGVAQDVGDRDVFRSRGNRFTSNAYGRGQRFVWADEELDAASWRAAEQDGDGRFGA